MVLLWSQHRAKRYDDVTLPVTDINYVRLSPRAPDYDVHKTCLRWLLIRYTQRHLDLDLELRYINQQHAQPIHVVMEFCCHVLGDGSLYS